MMSEIVKIHGVQPIPEKAVLLKSEGKVPADERPDQTIIDRKAALERTMGDEQFLSDLLKEFIETLPDIKERIANSIVRKNASALAKEANRLAGAAGNLGAVRLSDTAFDLEMAGRKGLIAEVHRSYRKLELEVKNFVDYVQTVEFDNSKQPVPSQA